MFNEFKSNEETKRQIWCVVFVCVCLYVFVFVCLFPCVDCVYMILFMCVCMNVGV